jgi:hypothetical protein
MKELIKHYHTVQLFPLILKRYMLQIIHTYNSTCERIYRTASIKVNAVNKKIEMNFKNNITNDKIKKQLQSQSYRAVSWPSVVSASYILRPLAPT